LDYGTPTHVTAKTTAQAAALLQNPHVKLVQSRYVGRRQVMIVRDTRQTPMPAEYAYRVRVTSFAHSFLVRFIDLRAHDQQHHRAVLQWQFD
jgi:hypothetical protein